MRIRLFPGLFLTTVFCLVLASALSLNTGLVSAQQAGARKATVWDGVYSAEQATRGRDEFETHCTICHGIDLGGGDDGPALIGEGFVRHWLEDNLDALFTKIQSRMPASSPGSLSGETYADLLAFVLQANDLPAGSGQLTPDHARLAEIMFVGKNGPGPVPDFSLVQVVGCLQKVDSKWTLTKGTEPLRARDPGAIAAAELPAQDARPLGAQGFELLDVNQPGVDGYAGRKVLVKGFLMRQPSARLNVTWVGPLSAACPAE